MSFWSNFLPDVLFDVIAIDIPVGLNKPKIKKMAQDIWPAAIQISYRLYDRSNFVTSKKRPAVMTG